MHLTLFSLFRWGASTLRTASLTHNCYRACRKRRAGLGAKMAVPLPSQRMQRPKAKKGAKPQKALPARGAPAEPPGGSG